MFLSFFILVCLLIDEDLAVSAETFVTIKKLHNLTTILLVLLHLFPVRVFTAAKSEGGIYYFARKQSRASNNIADFNWTSCIQNVPQSEQPDELLRHFEIDALARYTFRASGSSKTLVFKENTSIRDTRGYGISNCALIRFALWLNKRFHQRKKNPPVESRINLPNVLVKKHVNVIFSWNVWKFPWNFHNYYSLFTDRDSWTIPFTNTKREGREGDFILPEI